MLSGIAQYFKFLASFGARAVRAANNYLIIPIKALWNFRTLRSPQALFKFAIIHKNLFLLKLSIRLEINPNSTLDTDRNTGLDKAARCGDTEIVHALIQAAEINVNSSNIGGRTPLHLAAMCNEVELARALIQSTGINVNATDCGSFTPLHLAVQFCNIEIANVLIQATGINVNATDIDGNTSLHWAVKYGLTEFVQTLVQAAGINVNTLDKEDDTPLHEAAYFHYPEIIDLLVKKQADFNIVNKEGHTPLSEAELLASEPRGNQIVLDETTIANTVRPLIFQGADYSALRSPINPAIQKVIAERQNVVKTELVNIGLLGDLADIVCLYKP